MRFNTYEEVASTINSYIYTDHRGLGNVVMLVYPDLSIFIGRELERNIVNVLSKRGKCENVYIFKELTTPQTIHDLLVLCEGEYFFNKADEYIKNKGVENNMLHITIRDHMYLVPEGYTVLKDFDGENHIYNSSMNKVEIMFTLDGNAAILDPDFIGPKRLIVLEKTC